jgi:CheY-like chemotaxis protein
MRQEGMAGRWRMPTSRTLIDTLVFDFPTRVLVVDDDPILLETARAYLSTRGAEVATVADGNAALELLHKREFDIALVDIEMPGLGGIELVACLRSDETLRHIPAIMLTVRTDDEAIDRAYKAGATSYLTKPVNWRQLAYQVQQVTRASRARSVARKQVANAAIIAAQKRDFFGRPAQPESDKSFQVMVGILIVVALVMVLLGSTPKWQPGAPAPGSSASVLPAGTVVVPARHVHAPMRQVHHLDSLP